MAHSAHSELDMPVPYKNPDVVVRQEEDQHFLAFNPVNCLPLIMNATSHFIWEQCDGEKTSDDIKGAVAAAFDLDASGLSPEDVSRLVDEHLQILENAHLIVSE